MAMDWKTLKNEIDKENARILNTSPEDITRVFKYDILRNGAGTDGLMLGPWIDGATASRYVGPYFVYNIIKLAMDKSFSLNQVKEMLDLMLPKVVSTAELCGMETLGRFSTETLECVKEMTNVDDVLELLNSLYLYGSNMNAWIHHNMKWGIGQAFKINGKADIEAMYKSIDECYE